MSTGYLFHPTRLLELLGVDDYHIDWEETTVYLSPKGFSEVKAYFEKHPAAVEFEACGWRWRWREGRRKGGAEPGES